MTKMCIMKPTELITKITTGPLWVIIFSFSHMLFFGIVPAIWESWILRWTLKDLRNPLVTQRNVWKFLHSQMQLCPEPPPAKSGVYSEWVNRAQVIVRRGKAP